jgi:hypothetical protein
MERKTGSIFDIVALGPADISEARIPGLDHKRIMNYLKTKDDINKI